MSARDPGLRYESVSEALPFALDMYVRKAIHTSIPGIVKEYDPATKRARVQPAIRRAYYGKPSTFDRAQLLDVPVISQATGGFMIYAPLKVGDTVLVLFSERGLDEFKASKCEEVSDPTRGRYFDQMDAVAIKWGKETIEPIDADALCIQSESGNAQITMKDDEIVLRVGDKRIIINGRGIDMGRG